MSLSSPISCMTCNYAFYEADKHRDHYKSDWHRYNLKRKIADMPPVKREEFNQRVLDLKASLEVKQPEKEYCSTCKKHFSSKKSYENHCDSKKHQETALKSSEASSPNKDDSIEEEIEEVDSDEWEETSEPILPNACLFCSTESENSEENVVHMCKKHSFFIPDIEYLVDMDGLLRSLGETVGRDFICLWCMGKGRKLSSLYSVRQHMQDKGHCKLLFDDTVMDHYSDFYDYSSSYPEEGEVDEEVEVPVLDSDDFQLALPSGNTVGHRSLKIYYRQRFPPEHMQIERKKCDRIMCTYRAIGWTSNVTNVRRDREAQLQNKHSLQLGVKANKLQKHFRPQVNF